MVMVENGDIVYVVLFNTNIDEIFSTLEDAEYYVTSQQDSDMFPYSYYIEEWEVK